MDKSTYFKMFDGFIETLRSCKTHKDRSTLLLYMFDYWEYGTEPVNISESLKDKWRFIIQSMRTSRTNALNAATRYDEKSEESSTKVQENPMKTSGKVEEKLRKTGYKTDVKTLGKVEENSIDSEQVKQFSQPATQSTTQPTSHYIHEYRIENKGIENKETRNQKEEALLEHSYTEAEEREPLVSESGSGSQKIQGTGVPASGPSRTGDLGDEFEATCTNILERITSRYMEYGTAVFYTKNNAKEDFGIESDVFYRAIRKLVDDGLIIKSQSKTKDGKTVNKYVPMKKPVSPRLKVLSPNYRADVNGPSVRTHLSMFYKKNPIVYEESWDKETFLEKNSTLIDGALRGEMSGVCSNRKSYEDHLWAVTCDAVRRGMLMNSK